MNPLCISGIFIFSHLKLNNYSSLLVVSSKTHLLSELFVLHVKELYDHIRASVSLMPTSLGNPDHKELSRPLEN